MNQKGSISKLCVLTCILCLIPSILMDINQKGLDLVKNAEGFSERPYICPAGKLTVGYGHTGGITGPVTKEEAEKLLKADLKIAQYGVEQHIKVKLNPNQFSALVSLVYNIGIGNFATSHLKKYVNEGKFDLAANEFDKWTHANGQVLPGLVERRKAEKELFLS